MLPSFYFIYRTLYFYWYFNVAPISFRDWFSDLIAMFFRSLFGG
jgi:hypothetical protein